MNAHLALLQPFRTLLILVLVLTLRDGRSETLVFGTNQAVNFSLTVATNQAVVIYGGRVATSVWDVYWRITQFGEQYLLRVDQMSDPILAGPAGHPNILAGPLALELFIPATNLYDGNWMSYEVVPLAGLRTLIIPGLATNSVDVPAGTNFRLLARPASESTLNSASWQLISGSDRASLAMDFQGKDSQNLLLGMEFSGPLGIEIGNSTMEPRWFTYSLHRRTVQTLPGGVVSAAGVNALSVEESSDLVNWSAAAVILKDAAPNKFYRLKVSQ